MNSDRPLIVSLLLLGAGLVLIFGYCHGSAAFNAAYPAAGSHLQLSITTDGPAAMGGIVLTAIGLLAMIWALLMAILGQLRLLGSNIGSGRDRTERLGLDRFEREDRLDRLRESYPKE